MILFCMILLVCFGNINAEIYEGIDTLHIGEVIDFSNPESAIEFDLGYTITTGIERYSMLQSHYRGGIVFSGYSVLDSVKVAPDGGYSITFEQPDSMDVFCLLTSDKKYVKFIINSIGNGRIIIQWVYQDSGMLNFN